MNGAVYAGSIVRMGGKYMLGIPKAFREEAGISAGDKIKVTIEADIAPRTVEVPRTLPRPLKKPASWPHGRNRATRIAKNMSVMRKPKGPKRE